jgi:hypothetical protein
MGQTNKKQKLFFDDVDDMTFEGSESPIKTLDVNVKDERPFSQEKKKLISDGL